MKKWEYSSLTAQNRWSDNGPLDEITLAELNKLGAEGWEVVQIVTISKNQAFLLKREVPSPEVKYHCSLCKDTNRINGELCWNCEDE